MLASVGQCWKVLVSSVELTAVRRRFSDPEIDWAASTLWPRFNCNSPPFQTAAQWGGGLGEEAGGGGGVMDTWEALEQWIVGFEVELKQYI